MICPNLTFTGADRLRRLWYSKVAVTEVQIRKLFDETVTNALLKYSNFWQNLVTSYLGQGRLHFHRITQKPLDIHQFS